jgi:hypothetical protein
VAVVTEIIALHGGPMDGQEYLVERAPSDWYIAIPPDINLAAEPEDTLPPLPQVGIYRQRLDKRYTACRDDLGRLPYDWAGIR